MSHILLTGSRIYGEPRKDSDYDVGLLVTHDQLYFLADAAGVDLSKRPERGPDGCREYFTTTDATFKFGDLNVIALTDPLEFEGWVKGTQQCRDLFDSRQNAEGFPFGNPDAAVTRDEAKAIMLKAVDFAMAQESDYQI